MVEVKEEKVLSGGLGFDDAITSGEFIKFVKDEPRDLLLTRVRFEQIPDNAQFHAGEVALFADVHEDNGKVVEKTLQVTSNRLLNALRPHVEGKSGELKLTILMIGEKFQTQYSVRPFK
jgi:hypothetical protein